MVPYIELASCCELASDTKDKNKIHMSVLCRNVIIYGKKGGVGLDRYRNNIIGCYSVK